MENEKKNRDKRIRTCPLFFMLCLSIFLVMAGGCLASLYGGYEWKLTFEHPVFAAVILDERRADLTEEIEVAKEEEKKEEIQKAIDLMGEDLTHIEEKAVEEATVEVEEGMSDEAIERVNAEFLSIYGSEPYKLDENSEVSYVNWTNTSPRSIYYTMQEIRPVSSMYDYVQVDASYFDNSLFIGDSRIAGLADYSGWENTTFLYKIGLNVYRMMTDTVRTRTGEKMTVVDMLSSRQFDNIYIMSRVNELGMGVDEDFAAKYKENIDIIRELQPDARIIIMSIMYVTKSYSDSHGFECNDNINAKNVAIAELSNEENVYYLDVNPPVCDETGVLSGSMSFDGVHMAAKYYSLWTDYLCAHGY